MKISTLTTTGLESMTINSPLLETPANGVLLAQAIRVYLSRQRQATAKVKTRAEVSRTKKKWYKQKHTGGARHGARTPNIFVGGGVSHGPTGLQNYWMNLNQQMKRQALGAALAAQSAQLVITDLAQSAKVLRTALNSLKSESILVITPERNLDVVKAIGNMGAVQVTSAARVTVVDVLKAQYVVMSADTLKALEARLLEAPTVAPKAAAKAVTAEVKTEAKKPVAKKATTSKAATKTKTTKKTA